MGFRTTFVSQDYWLELPDWFVVKWPGIHVGEDSDGKKTLPISSKFERKFYNDKDEEELFLDLQKVLQEQTGSKLKLKDFEICLFHECGGITKVHIGHDFIRLYEPQEWHEVEQSSHYYCYGCSTPPKVKGEESE